MQPEQDPDYFALLPLKPRLAKELARLGVSTLAALLALDPGTPGIKALQDEGRRILAYCEKVGADLAGQLEWRGRGHPLAGFEDALVRGDFI
jgi:hypothetical protein